MITRVRRWSRIFMDAVNLWLERNAFQLAGSLAFYTLFSLAPVVIIAVSIIALFFGEDAAQGQIAAQLQDIVGREGAETVEHAVAESRIERTGPIPMIVGGVALLIGATTVFAQMQLSLNAIWGVTAKPSKSGIIIFLLSRLMSLALVLTIGFIFLVSLLLSVATRAAVRFAEHYIPFSATLLSGAEVALSFLVITLLFAAIFKILPDVHIGWREVWIGAALTAVLFGLGRYLISVYLAHTATASTYGAAGSLVLILLWVYYSSLILFFGAAFTKVHSLARGKTVVPRRMAVRVVQEIVEEDPDEQVD